jgi:hypothetical protein
MPIGNLAKRGDTGAIRERYGRVQICLTCCAGGTKGADVPITLEPASTRFYSEDHLLGEGRQIPLEVTAESVRSEVARFLF